MSQKPSSVGEENIENVSSSVASQEHEQGDDLARHTTKVNRRGIALVPQPTDDPHDPLVCGSERGKHSPFPTTGVYKITDLYLSLLKNWSTAKKSTTFCIVCLASFAGIIQALANTSGFFAQAELYHKTPVDISYSVS